MKILFYNNILYDVETFNKQVLQNEIVDGIVMNVVMTKDGQMIIVIFSDEGIIVQGLEKYTYEQTKEDAFILLDEVLSLNINKRVLINAIISPQYLNFKDLDRYTTNLTNVINKHPNIDISVFSLSYPLITALKPKLSRNKIGVLLSADNATYIDVDFYIFPPILLNPSILNQQFNNKKEIMILLQDWNDLNQTNRFFTNETNKSQLPRGLVDSISVLTRYPDITYNTIKNI